MENNMIQDIKNNESLSLEEKNENLNTIPRSSSGNPFLSITKIIATLNFEENGFLQTLIEKEVDLIRFDFSELNIPLQEDLDKIDFALKQYKDTNPNGKEKFKPLLAFDIPGLVDIRTENSVEFMQGDLIRLAYTNSSFDKIERNLKISGIKSKYIRKGMKIWIQHFEFIVIVANDTNCLIMATDEGEIEENEIVFIQNYYGIPEGSNCEKILEKAIEYRIPYIFLNAVQDGIYVAIIRNYLEKLKKDYKPILIAKIDSIKSLFGIEEILELSDGIIISREIFLEKLDEEGCSHLNKSLDLLREYYKNKIFIDDIIYSKEFKVQDVFCELNFLSFSAVEKNSDALMINNMTLKNFNETFEILKTNVLVYEKYKYTLKLTEIQKKSDSKTTKIEKEINTSDSGDLNGAEKKIFNFKLPDYLQNGPKIVTEERRENFSDIHILDEHLREKYLLFRGYFFQSRPTAISSKRNK